MAFSFGAPNPAGGSASAELGPELPDVFTDVCYPRHSFRLLWPLDLTQL